MAALSAMSEFAQKSRTCRRYIFGVIYTWFGPFVIVRVVQQSMGSVLSGVEGRKLRSAGQAVGEGKMGIKGGEAKTN